MNATSFLRDGVELTAYESGDGVPVIFQHGLGGDVAQVAEVFPDGPHLRRLTLECRAQGMSHCGPFDRLSIRTFADDVLALADSLGIEQFVVGGISMGAAIALRLAVTVPHRVRGLVIARPAWLWDPAPTNMEPFADLARYLAQADLAQAKVQFERSETATTLAIEAPDNLASLLKFFSDPDPLTTAHLLAQIAADGPGVTREQVRALSVPTLVIGHGADVVHPLAYARTLAAEIDGARLIEVTSKVASKARYVEDFRSALKTFLEDAVASNDGTPSPSRSS